MASQGGTTSRLGQMQMRFQAKLQQEQNQKRNDLNSPNSGDLYRTTTTTTRTSSVTTNGTGSGNAVVGGKVRQLFQERRQRGIGIDKSYPLQPITTTTTPPGKRLDNVRPSPLGHTRTVTGGYSPTNRIGATPPSRLSHLDVPREPSYGGLNGKMTGLRITSEINNNNVIGSGSIKLKPVTLPASSSAISPGTVVNGLSSKSPVGSRPLKPVVGLKSAAKTVAATTVVRKPTAPPADNMGDCRICGRYFNLDRIAKHETICEKSSTKKRKVFDVVKHRVKGTDAESYVTKKGRSKGGVTPAQKTIAGVVIKTDAKKGNWRQKHEEFIATIRAAKEMKAHLARGGKLSDLPPPPPSENPDYVQCPHCSRRFNEAAATRHIPKCATMLHNKPKPVKRKL